MFQPYLPNAFHRASLWMCMLLAAVTGCSSSEPPKESAKDGAQTAGARSQPTAGTNAGTGGAGSGSNPRAGAPAAAAAGRGGAGGSKPSQPEPEAGSAAGKGPEAGSGGAGQPASDGGEADSGSVDIAAIASSLATAVCDALLECVGPAKLAALTGREDCAARFGASLQQDDFGSLETSLAAGHVVLDPSELTTCYDDTRALGCAVQTERLPESCERAIAGQRKAGESCTLGADCVPDAFCPVAAECPRTCTATQPEGQACVRDDGCQRGLICNEQTCTRPAAIGAACAATSGGVCAFGSSCVGSTDVLAGTCQTNATIQAGELGATCIPGRALCREGLSCAYDSPQVFKCQGPVAKGEPCHLALPGQCPVDSYCNAADPAAVGTCIDLPEEGEPCVLIDECAAGHVCVIENSTVTCRRLGDLGDACLADGLCRSGTCSDGTCSVRAACD